MSPEILGLIASAVLLLGGLMQNEKKLRIIDSVGSLMFTVYGVLIGAFSVILLNGCMTLAHVYRAARLLREEKTDKADKSTI